MNVDVPLIVNQISTPVNTSGILGVMSPAALPLIDVACCVPLVRRPLTAEAATDLARTLKAIADPARLRLLSMIAAHEGGEACVCDLTEPLGLTQPTVSHHLKVLVDAGLLTRDKRGVWAYFTLVPGALDSLADVLSTQGAGAS
jgi:ArsR family transcriptional regulator, arsenate/arsenite/antimonite-responsive transcriptional repressor